MSVNCPHCCADIGKSKDPSEFPWDDGEDKEMTCDTCNEKFFIRAVSDIRWLVFKNEEEMDFL